jgi:Ca2+-binding RTX toxin-like protein
MVTIRSLASPRVLVEEAGTATTPRFQLDQAPPVGELTATEGNVPKSLAGYKVDPGNSAIAQSADRRPRPIRGTNQSDRMAGTSQDDLLEGLGGNDGLFGNAGSDTLFGGDGFDWLRSDGGRDVFFTQTGVGVDTIADFRNNQDLIGIGINVSFEQLDIVQQGSNTLIRLGRDELAHTTNSPMCSALAVASM